MIQELEEENDPNKVSYQSTVRDRKGFKQTVIAEVEEADSPDITRGKI